MLMGLRYILFVRNETTNLKGFGKVGKEQCSLLNRSWKSFEDDLKNFEKKFDIESETDYIPKAL